MHYQFFHMVESYSTVHKRQGTPDESEERIHISPICCFSIFLVFRGKSGHSFITLREMGKGIDWFTIEWTEYITTNVTSTKDAKKDSLSGSKDAARGRSN